MIFLIVLSHDWRLNEHAIDFEILFNSVLYVLVARVFELISEAHSRLLFFHLFEHLQQLLRIASRVINVIVHRIFNRFVCVVHFWVLSIALKLFVNQSVCLRRSDHALDVDF